MFALPFEGPRLKIAHAKRHIKTLAETIEAFRKTVRIRIETVEHPSEYPKEPQKPREGIEFDPDYPPLTADDVISYGFRFTEAAPTEIPLLMGDAIHNLRTSLDLTMCDLARVRAKSTADVKFPFAESAEKLAEILAKKEYRRLGNDITDTIANLGPFKGGHVGLRGLHDLDVSDKHKLLLPTYIVAFANMPMPNVVENLFRQRLGISLSQSRVSISEGTSLTLRKDIDPRGVFVLIDGGPQPVFGNKLPFAGEPVLKTLENLSQMTLEIVELLAGKFGGGDNNAPSPPV